MSDHASLERLLREGRSHLEALGAQGALVLLKTPQGDLTVRKARGLEAQEVPARNEAFQAVLQSGDAVLVLDARQDRRFKELGQVARSALCVPILGEGDTVVGLLYGESSQPGIFSHKHRADMLAFGRKLGQSVSEVLQPAADEARPAAAAPSPGPSEPNPWKAGLALPVGFLILALLWPFVVGGLTSKPEPRPVTQTATPLPEPDPAITVRSFLLLVQFEKFEEAYRLLAPELKARLPLEAFRSQAASWLQEETNRADLPYRRAVAQEQNKESAVVRIEPGGQGGSTWVWTLNRVDRDWLIVRPEGGPL